MLSRAKLAVDALDMALREGSEREDELLQLLVENLAPMYEEAASNGGGGGGGGRRRRADAQPEPSGGHALPLLLSRQAERRAVDAALNGGALDGGGTAGIGRLTSASVALQHPHHLINLGKGVGKGTVALLGGSVGGTVALLSGQP